MLFEYGFSSGILALDFEFNPSSITRTVSVKPGDRSKVPGGYDFMTPLEAMRAAQGVVAEPESFDITILLDATDRMDAGNLKAGTLGIQPELDVIRSMLKPTSQQPSGAKMLAALGVDGKNSSSEYQAMPVLLFKWGVHILPVFMTQARTEIKAFLPSLIPYRAEVTLNLQIIESNNPFYTVETLRQTLSAMSNSITTILPGI